MIVLTLPPLSLSHFLSHIYARSRRPSVCLNRFSLPDASSLSHALSLSLVLFVPHSFSLSQSLTCSPPDVRSLSLSLVLSYTSPVLFFSHVRCLSHTRPLIHANRCFSVSLTHISPPFLKHTLVLSDSLPSCLSHSVPLPLLSHTLVRL